MNSNATPSTNSPAENLPVPRQQTLNPATENRPEIPTKTDSDYELWYTKRHQITLDVFDKLIARYGTRLAQLWNGTTIEAVHKTWTEDLATFTRREIAGALDLLKDFENHGRPPISSEFRQLCWKARGSIEPAHQRLKLPEPQISDEARQAAADGQRRFRELQEAEKPPVHRTWARRAIENHNAGIAILPFAALEIARRNLEREERDAASARVQEHDAAELARQKEKLASSLELSESAPAGAQA